MSFINLYLFFDIILKVTNRKVHVICPAEDCKEELNIEDF